MTVAVVDSGSGNLRSVARALERVGAEPAVTSDPDAVRRADRLVVPGQGAFSDCMGALRARGLDEAIVEAIRAGVPYFGICLGLQVLYDESEEHGPAPGLGVLRGRSVRLAAEGGRKVPHMGWNEVEARRDDPLLAGVPAGAHVYFVHSYYVVPQEPETVVLTCDYGGEITAAVRRDNVFACQFHPEKSQAVGLAMLEAFAGGRA